MHLRHADTRAVAEFPYVLDVTGMSLADYSFTSLGNLQRFNRAIDWIQRRDHGSSQCNSGCSCQRRPSVGNGIHCMIDCTQKGAWETYRYAQRVGLKLIDETLLNSIENGADCMINAFRRQPAEILVHTPDSTSGTHR